ncbi:MAG: alpha/beta hydrolase [Clostridiales bacterium]|nr:alpha/beta hydrolase [Clostridiales bacterium]
MYFEQSGNGKPVVYLHGWGCDGSIFASVVKQLPNYCNYTVDFAGFGRSVEPPIEGYSVEDYAEQLKAFLSEQELQGVTLVGHSFGCRVAMVLSAKYPELVSGLLLVAPAGLRRFSFSRWWKVRRYKLSKFFARLNNTQPQMKYASEDYLNCSPAMRATFVKVVNADLSAYAKRVKCPVLIVNGRQDTATPLKHAKQLNKLIANSTLVEIEGDHFALFRAPVAFANTVKNFVE